MKKITLLFLATFFVANVFGQDRALPLLGTNTFPLNGNAGIGTVTPTNTLHIYKNATVGWWTGLTTGNAGLRIQDSGYSMYFDGNSIITNGEFVIGTNAEKEISFGTNSIERLTIDENGKVGIGTASPLKNLDVNGDINFSGNLYRNGQLVDLSGNTVIDTSSLSETVGSLIFENGDQKNAIGTDTDGNLVFYRNSVSETTKTLVINDDNGNVMIGATDPNYGRLRINTPALGNNCMLSFTTFDGYYQPRIYFRHNTSPTRQYLEFTSNYSKEIGRADFIFSYGKVGIGTTAPAYLLSVKGTIGCGEVIVEDVSGWADFVFEDDYKLMSLKDLENYIKANKHLPEIPTTAEVEENGISVGDMNAKLLQKVEELTLYTIQQQDLIEALIKRVEQLENK